MSFGPDEFDDAEGDAMAEGWAEGGGGADTCDVDSRARLLRLPCRRNRVPTSRDAGMRLSAVPIQVDLKGLVMPLVRAGPSGPRTRGGWICFVCAARKPLDPRALGGVLANGAGEPRL